MKQNHINFVNRILNTCGVVEIDCLEEMAHSGPVIGKLFIDNIEAFPGKWFGGPMFEFDKYIYNPVLVIKLLGSKFRMAKIDVCNRKMIEFGNLEDIIIIDKVNSSSVEYYIDAYKKIMIKIEL